MTQPRRRRKILNCMTALTAIAALLIALGVGYRLGRRSSSPRRQRRARGRYLPT
ncbi:hypothetical protein BZL30_4726 [Mycobacterium kansasii]|uniref:Uncharacterized protein n=1 Tax=Mycobacterium kansasii TaxID=1768 RepID=A0A1V3XEF5_MYCKA|nr:hypothetical protein BZL30_4726 [Mycobacterium kansasii]OOK77552.1 hypothetical protein BZL29_4005 [Mycobacterium kansasii]